MSTEYYKIFYIDGDGISRVFPSSRKFSSLEEIQKLIPDSRFQHSVQFPRTRKYIIAGHTDKIVIKYMYTLNMRLTRIVSILPRISNDWININYAT